MNAKQTALDLFPEMPIPTGLIAKLCTAARNEDIATALIAAYKLGYKKGTEDNKKA